MSLSSLHLAEPEEKVVRFVLDKARTEGRPCRKLEIDKFVADQSRPLIDELVKMELLREENNQFYPTLQAMLAEPETYGDVIRSLDAVIAYGKAAFSNDQQTIKVQELVSAIVGEHKVLAVPSSRFLFECALFGLPASFVGVQSLTSTRAPDELYFHPSIQRASTLADMFPGRTAGELETEENFALHELYKAYLFRGDRRRAIIGFRTQGQLRTLRRLLDAGKVEQDGTSGFFLSQAGLEEVKQRFGSDDNEHAEPRVTATAKGAIMDPRKVLVIYGRDLRARDAMFDFLRALNLDPIEWSKATRMTGSASPYTGQILETAFAQARAVVALFTGDDEAHLRAALLGPHEKQEALTPQPRPNVLFEAGMAFGLRPDRVVLVEVGQLRGLSDLTGRHTVRIPELKQWRLEIANRLLTAGCAVDMSGHDWLEKGAALQELASPEVTSPGDARVPSAPKAPQRPEAELRHLFRLAITKRVEANGTDVIDLRKERLGDEEWSTLSEEMLADELHRMRDQQIIVIQSEVGAVFELVSVPSTVRDVSEFERVRW